MDELEREIRMRIEDKRYLKTPRPHTEKKFYLKIEIKATEFKHLKSAIKSLIFHLWEIWCRQNNSDIESRGKDDPYVAKKHTIEQRGVFKLTYSANLPSEDEWREYQQKRYLKKIE